MQVNKLQWIVIKMFMVLCANYMSVKLISMKVDQRMSKKFSEFENNLEMFREAVNMDMEPKNQKPS